VLLFVFRADGEIQDIFLRQADMLDELPRRVRQSLRHLSSRGNRHALHSGVEIRVCVRPVEHFCDLFSNGFRSVHDGHPCGLNTRSVDAGNFASLSAGRLGRTTRSPPQLGQRFARRSAHERQNVHSNVQMNASLESAGSSRSQHSQPGRS
jgi:hypothetical protein